LAKAFGSQPATILVGNSAKPAAPVVGKTLARRWAIINAGAESAAQLHGALRQ